MTVPAWTARDEVLYWLQAFATYTALAAIAVLRFVFAVVFRVLEVGVIVAVVVALAAALDP
jgi:hypothetical protein